MSSLRTSARFACTIALLAAMGCGSPETIDLTGRWIPESVPSEEWGPNFQPSKAAIEFNDEGRWKASDGCNQLEGTYTVDGEDFQSPPSGNFAGVGCVGGEVPYDRLLPKVSSVKMSGEKLEFLDDSGSLLLRLGPG